MSDIPIILSLNDININYWYQSGPSKKFQVDLSQFFQIM